MTMNQPEQAEQGEPVVQPEPAVQGEQPEQAVEPVQAVQAVEPLQALQAVQAVQPESAIDLPPSEPQPAKKDRRRLRAAARWVSAVAVFAVVGTGTAYGITRADRTDVPGLATHSDGRWEYPTLVKPPLPSGSPAPFAEANKVNAHYADLRRLVLPAPRGATADGALRGADGWLATKDFLALYADKADREELAGKLADYGLRHIAARGWTTPDGTHTGIYLLQFGSATITEKLLNTEMIVDDAPAYTVRGADTFLRDEEFPDAARITDVLLAPYVEDKPYGAEQVRLVCLAAGDTFGVIVQSRKGEALAVPFQQTVTLQSELLG
ncbi:hypothetical protein [Streptomyces sp. GbtcB6]|uniref:hypothetical protein n=1 Tax=Streptomyces sp. GbtcB6 TaxID=2824751 RepID=UPI0020C5E5B6|nr:hypothetical protein [Streptomyces sp. GbtcB6]